MNPIISCQFTIKAHDKLGSLERILRVIRHRGGYVNHLQMQATENKTLHLTLKLTTERSIDALQSQIAKLVDVISIEK